MGALSIKNQNLITPLTGGRIVAKLLFSAIALICLTTTQSFAVQEGTSFLARKGNAALMRRQNEKAIESLSQALATSNIPTYNQAALLNDRALAFTRIGNFERAIDDFNRAIEIFPEFATAYNNRGLLLHRLGNFSEAIKDFNRAIALQPNMGFGYHNRANSLIKTGIEHSAFKDYGTAISLLSNNAVPHLARSQIHMKYKRHYAAMRELNQALNVNAKYSDAIFFRSSVWLSLGNSTKALDDAITASDLEPENIEYQMRRAKIRLEKGQHKFARKIYGQIITNNPENREALIGRARANALRGVYGPALEDLDLAVTLQPDAAAFAERALVHAQSGNLDLAAADTSTAIQHAPKTARSWVALANAAIKSDLTEHAERYFLEALKRDKNNSEALQGLIEIEKIVPQFIPELIGGEVDGWAIYKGVKGGYQAENPKYPRLKVRLDMYGKQKPKILEWTVLGGTYKGFALLRYDTGYDDQKNPREHVAVLNLKKNRISSIEPYRWGKSIAKWSWNPNDVVIEDPDGIQSKIVLRVPRKKRIRNRQNDWFSSSDGFFSSLNKPKPAKRKKRRRYKKKKKKKWGIFSF